MVTGAQVEATDLAGRNVGVVRTGQVAGFGSAQEAEESPAVLVEYARAWLESEESEPYRQMAAELDDDTDLR